MFTFLFQRDMIDDSECRYYRHHPFHDFRGLIKYTFILSSLCRIPMVLQLLARLFTSQPRLPTFDELPSFHDMLGCGWIWGEDDQLGTVNLLSDEVVRRACREEVRYASTIH